MIGDVLFFILIVVLLLLLSNVFLWFRGIDVFLLESLLWKEFFLVLLKLWDILLDVVIYGVLFLVLECLIIVLLFKFFDKEWVVLWVLEWFCRGVLLVVVNLLCVFCLEICRFINVLERFV